MNQFHFTPEHYLERIRAEVASYDELQSRTAEATRGVEARTILELGVGTGETGARVLQLHPGAQLVGIDESPPMLEHARAVLPPERVELRVGRLQDPLPEGPFDLAVSTLVVHHLTSDEKRDLFRRIREELAPGGRFVLADVVATEHPEDALIPIEEGYDLPDPLDDQLEWLEQAGFRPSVAWEWKDVAVVAADAG